MCFFTNSNQSFVQVKNNKAPIAFKSHRTNAISSFPKWTERILGFRKTEYLALKKLSFSQKTFQTQLSWKDYKFLFWMFYGNDLCFE